MKEKIISYWPSVRSFLQAYLATILGAIILGWLIHAFVFSGSQVKGTSMEPTLKDGQYIFVNRLANIKRGDMVVFNAKKVDPRNQGQKEYVKRIIGLPGDTVEYRDGVLYINNHRIQQSYLTAYQKKVGTELIFGDPWDLKSLSSGTLWKKEDRNQTKVPAGQYFVLGDHRSVSNDSRYFGFVPKSALRGKVVVPFWAH